MYIINTAFSEIVYSRYTLVLAWLKVKVQFHLNTMMHSTLIMQKGF